MMVAAGVNADEAPDEAQTGTRLTGSTAGALPEPGRGVGGRRLGR